MASFDLFPSPRPSLLPEMVTNPPPSPFSTVQDRANMQAVPPVEVSADLVAQTAAKFVDRLTLRFKLSMGQKDDLLALYQIGTSFQDPLGRADVMARVYFLACQYGIEQRSLAAGPTEGPDGGELVRLIKELKIRLDDNFQITKDQKAHIRLLSQEYISRSTRTSYKNLYLDVEKKMRARPDTYKMSNIFGNLTREQKWASEAKRIASNTRNVFRQEIRDGIIGKKKCSLQDFTSDCLARYRLAVGSTTEQGHLIRYVILRRFAWENRSLLRQSEEDSEDDEELSADSGDPFEGAPKKCKRSTLGRGRVAHGKDFWSKVDTWLREKITLWTNDFCSAQWKSYVDESIRLDNDRYITKMPLLALQMDFPQSDLQAASLLQQHQETIMADSTPATSSQFRPMPVLQNTQMYLEHGLGAASTSMVNDFLQNI